MGHHARPTMQKDLLNAKEASCKQPIVLKVAALPLCIVHCECLCQSHQISHTVLHAEAVPRRTPITLLAYTADAGNADRLVFATW